MLVPMSENLGSYRFTSRQPMSSGATCSAGRAEEGVGEVLGGRGGYGGRLGKAVLRDAERTGNLG